MTRELKGSESGGKVVGTATDVSPARCERISLCSRVAVHTSEGHRVTWGDYLFQSA